MTTLREQKGYDICIPYGPSRFRRREVINALEKKLKGRVRLGFLIGSYARDEAHSTSDVDVILVADSTRAFVDRFRDFMDLIELFDAIDLIVYTPREWEQIKNDRASFAFAATRGAVRLSL